MADLLEVKGYPGLVRDPDTNAILNVDVQAIELARAKKLARQERKNKDDQLETRLSGLENDIKDIKDLLTLLTKNL